MEDKKRSRRIPKDIADRLLSEMRHRCCLCRAMIDPSRFEAEALSDTLEKHHVVLFSEGGGHEYDNLILLCASCHSRVHADPANYTVEKLKEQKEHWIRLKAVVPSSLALSNRDQDQIQILFSVESLNLQYSISASPVTTVSKLAEYVKEVILRTLGEQDDNMNWTQVEEIGLALKSSPMLPLPLSMKLKDIKSISDEILVAIIKQPVMAMVKPFRESDFPSRAIGRIIRDELHYSLSHIHRHISEQVAHQIYREVEGHPLFSQLKETGIDTEAIVYLVCNDVISHRLERFEYELSDVGSEFIHRFMERIGEAAKKSNP